MGVDHNAYIGPYLRVTQTVTKGQGDYCKDHNRGDAAFCPQCGKSKKDRYYTFEDNGAPNNWQEEYEKGSFYDYLTSTSFMGSPDLVDGKRTHLYLPNRYYKELNIPSIDGGKYSKEEVPFDEIDVPGTLKTFKKLFKDEIAYLEKWFEVEVKFGYVSYCS
jgi:hypothetical protein